jgi:hypothetical protein
MANQASHAGALGIIGLDPDTVAEGSIPLRRFGCWPGWSARPLPLGADERRCVCFRGGRQGKQVSEI